MAETMIEGSSAAVVDGDTIDFGGARIRLHGVDAPEAGQRCGRAGGGTWACGARAIGRMAELVEGASVSCAPVGEDGYGRVLAVCEAGGVNIGAALVREGLAWVFRRYSDAYVDEEDAARREKRGIWQGEAEPPWDYRARRWSHAAAAAPMPGCPIKGNISPKGERIYHPPWSPWYERTRINEARGERWFCDEAEAVAAGWRAARWR